MFNINGEEWQVVLVSEDHPTMYRSDGSHTIGCCDNETKTIYIYDQLDCLKMKKVLCHEITHAAMFSYGVELNLSQEELLADMIATYGQEIIYITNSFFCRLGECGCEG